MQDFALQDQVFNEATTQPDNLDCRLAQTLGRVISVSGAQLTMRFSAEALADVPSNPAVTVGAFVGVETGRSLAVGVLGEMALDEREGSAALGRIDLLGEIKWQEKNGGGFQRGVSIYPKIGDAAVRLGNSELHTIFDASAPHTIEVGHLHHDDSIGAYVDVDEMVRKHFAVFGSTGAGKSSAIALILREIIDARSDLRVFVIDPHNEYGRCFGDQVQVVNVGNLSLPYWLFNFEELVEVIFGRRPDVDEEVALLSELIPLAKDAFAAAAGSNRLSRQLGAAGPGFTVDTPVPYRLEDLISLIESRMGKLENRAIALQYQRLLGRIHAVRKNPRYGFMLNGDGDTMVDVLCQLFRLGDDARPMTVLQLAGFPAEVLDPAISVLFRLAFDLGLWSDGSVPLLIVCEEAHNYANADPVRGFRPAREALARIAKEGRKHGVFLGLVTQRVAELDPTLISQCSTVFAMRMANESDQKIIQAAVSDPGNRLLGFLPSLGTRETLAFGEGVPIAMRLRFKELPEHGTPQSEALWSGDALPDSKIDRSFVTSVVARWRGLAAAKKPAAPDPGLESLFLPAERSMNPSSWIR